MQRIVPIVANERPGAEAAGLPIEEALDFEEV